MRAKLTEPVRMYVYGFGFPGIGAALFIDDVFPAMGEPLAALLAALGIVLGAEAARASSCSYGQMLHHDADSLRRFLASVAPTKENHR